MMHFPFFWTILVTLLTREQSKSLQRGLREFCGSSNHSTMKLSKSCNEALTKDGFEPSGFISDSVSFEHFSDGFTFKLMFHLLCNIERTDNERHQKMVFKL